MALSTTSLASYTPWPFRGRATPKRPKEARRRPPTSCPASAKSSMTRYFGGIEITQIKDPGLRAQVARMLADAKMEVIYSAQPVQLLNEDNLVDPTDISSLDEIHRRRAIDRLKACIDEALEIGAVRSASSAGKIPARPTGYRLWRP